MLECSMDIIYILFAEKFEAKTNKYFPFQNIYFLHGKSFVKIVPISHILIIGKGAHSNVCHGRHFA